MLGFDTGSFTLYVERGTKSEPVFEYEVDDVQEAKARLMARDPFGMIFNLTPR